MGKNQTLIGGLILLALVFFVGLILYSQNTSSLQVSTYSLSPTPILTPTKTPEPQVLSWLEYHNDQYSFTINYPEGWNEQEFIPESGGLIVGFSPNSLPCKSCTYIHDGYYSVRIFNQKTNPQAYADYTAKVANGQKSKDILPIQVDGVSGILTGNYVAIENHGWVYEVALDTDNGGDKAINSQIFQEAVTSFKFTYLLFNQ